MELIFHTYPEVDFELERTVALVEGELDKIGIRYTDHYGTCSLVVELGQGIYVLATADMDALSVVKKIELPYRFQNLGMMHACGFDSHAAVFGSVAQYLNLNEA